MAQNQGTHVIAKVVTPDDQDTFATHEDFYGQGGMRAVTTYQDMLDITQERRKAGMECRVVNDPDPGNNGKYILQDDLTTWFKEQFSNLLGDPPDDGWGLGDSDTHELTGIATGDDLENRWEKLFNYLDLISQSPPSEIDLSSIVIPKLYTASKQGEIGHVLHDNVQTDIQPIGTLDTKFGNAILGIVNAVIDGSVEGSLQLTPLPAGTDNGTNGALALFGEETYNNVYQQIGALIQAQTPLFLHNIKHTYRLEHGLKATEADFYIDDPIQPSIINIAMVGEHTAGVKFISGVPTLAVNDRLKITFTLINAVSWYYNALNLGRIESAYTNDLDTGLIGNLNRGDNILFADQVTQVLTGVYTENATVTIKGYNSRALTSEAIATDTAEETTEGTSGKIRIDTVSNETQRVKSGDGQFPDISPSGAGNAYNSTQDLSMNEELQLVGGIYRYPSGDYSNNNPTPGPNYDNINPGTHNNIRWATFDLGLNEQDSYVKFQIPDANNFSGMPFEQGMEMYVKVEGSTSWLDANAPYPGTGDPVNDGDAALDTNNSNTTIKRVTFGKTLRQGTVYVRIGLPQGSDKSFSNIQRIID